MQINVSMQGGSVGGELVELFERQVGYALGRFHPRIRAVRLRLRDLNADKGGVDKHGRITAALRDGGTLTAEVTDTAYAGVIHRCVERLARQVQRQWGEARTRARSAAAARKRDTGVGE
ncbi:MAG TPA: hypothetical protein P5572_08695 [Phycisphaerae bacterium]|nr:hypothetical protein [Phycisphaerales bacterium]HRX85082.1 hypothetical protein [Phycisphaerae bacterium]